MNEFQELGITGNSEMDYRELAKYLVGAEMATDAEHVKARGYHSRCGNTRRHGSHGHAYAHPKLGEGGVKSSSIADITFDERATGYVETRNTSLCCRASGVEGTASPEPPIQRCK